MSLRLFTAVRSRRVVSQSLVDRRRRWRRQLSLSLALSVPLTVAGSMVTATGALAAPHALVANSALTGSGALPVSGALPSTVAAGSRLVPGIRLTAGRSLVNGMSRLTMGYDGNLLLSTGPGVVMWSSRSPGNPGGYAELKANNQLVVRARDGHITFASPLRAGTRPVLALNNDGNMIIWTAARPIWSTNSWVKGYAVSRMPSYGWSKAQWPCLAWLWERESSWDWRARNSSSGAYGIPQALPGAKMATAGGDWLTNYRTQITWGLGYIADRYGSPCAAWAHSQQYGWYGAPGKVALGH